MTSSNVHLARPSACGSLAPVPRRARFRLNAPRGVLLRALALGCTSEGVDLGGGLSTRALTGDSRCVDSPIIEGSVRVTSQEELAALQGCEEIRGDLEVQLFPDADLTPLGSLRVVESVLVLGDSALDLVDDFDDAVPPPSPQRSECSPCACDRAGTVFHFRSRLASPPAESGRLQPRGRAPFMDRGPRGVSGWFARRPGMLWNRRKSAEMPAVDPTSPAGSGYRDADTDRGLDGLRNLLECYGRFAFDTDESSALQIREQCETWAQRIVLGAPRRQNAGEAASEGPARRDWPGLNRFFEDQRKRESSYVTRSLAALRQTVLAFARSLSGASGEDQTSDARVEKHLAALSNALEQNDPRRIANAAASVIETARESMAQRRKREARQIVDLGAQLRQVREELAVSGDSAGADEVTGLHNRAAFEQQLEQLAAMGLLLEDRPWLLVLEVDQLAGVCQRYGQPLADDVLRQVSNVLTRTFLRKQDFVARYSSERLAVLLVDITHDQLIGAVERVLAGVHKVAIRPTLSRALSITASIGVTPLRPNDSPSTWMSRAHLALERAQEDGRDRYELAP